MPKNAKSTKKYKVNSHKVGNSTMITIPKDIVKKAPWVVRDGGNVSYNAGVVTITKPKKLKAHKNDLLDFLGIFKTELKIPMSKTLSEIKETRYEDRIKNNLS